LRIFCETFYFQSGALRDQRSSSGIRENVEYGFNACLYFVRLFIFKAEL
jgi:hypothetical protein